MVGGLGLKVSNVLGLLRTGGIPGRLLLLISAALVVGSGNLYRPERANDTARQRDSSSTGTDADRGVRANEVST